MRTRSKTLYSENTSGGPWADTADNDHNNSYETTVATGTSGTYLTSDVGETMIDDPGPNRGIKAVDHEKYNFYASSPNAIWYRYLNVDHVLNGNNVCFSQYGYPARFSRSEIRIDWAKSYGEQLRDTIAKFLDDNDVDTFVGLTELHQIPGTIQSLWKLMNTEEIVRALRKRPKVSAVQTALSHTDAKRLAKARQLVGSAARNVSNAHLAWSFGIAPLLSDMAKLQKGFRSLKADLEKNSRLAGRVTNVRTRVTGSQQLVTPGRVGTIHYNKELQRLGTPTRIITVQGIRSQQFDSKFLRDTSFLLNKFGSNGPASFVWEKLPYSFVVDWFADTRVLIGALDNLSKGAPKRILNTYSSEKWSASIDARLTDDYAGGKFPVWFTRPIVSSTVLSSYTRKSTNLSNSKLLGASGRFGKKQLLLTWDLIYQKIAKR
jgi:hypothetical protein